MLRIGKVGIAIVMGLMLSLTLLASGAFADDTMTAQNSAGVTTRNAIVIGDIQQGTQQMLPLPSTQALKTSQASVLCVGRYCRTYRRYYPRRIYRYYPRRIYRYYPRRIYRYYPRRIYRYYPRRIYRYYPRRNYRRYYPRRIYRRSYSRYGRFGR